MTTVMDNLTSTISMVTNTMVTNTVVNGSTTVPPVVIPPPAPRLTLHDILNRYIEYRCSQRLGLYGLPVLLILGTVGNLLTFLIMIKPSMRKSSTCFYMAILAVFDTCVLYFSCLRRWLVFLHGSDALRLSAAACKTFNFLSYMFFDLAVWTIVAMTIERFIAIHFPLKAPKYASISRGRKVVALLVVIFCAINVHFFWTVTIDNRGYCSNLDEFDHFHGNVWPWLDATLYSFLPFLILLIFNVVIIYDNRKSILRRSTMREGRKRKGQRSGFQFRLSSMLLTVSFTFLLLSAPNVILISIRHKYFDFTSGAIDFHNIAVYTLVSMVTQYCLYLNHSVNFLLYCVSGQRFRKELRYLLTCKWTVQQIRTSTMSMSDVTRSQRISETSECSRDSYVTETAHHRPAVTEVQTPPSCPAVITADSNHEGSNYI